MKQVLLVSYVFPPEPSAGALRVGYLARYLPEHGWGVTALTKSTLVPPFPVDVTTTGARKNALDYLPFRVRDRILIPDAGAGWIPGAIADGLRVIRARQFDAILSSAHPPSVHVVGWALSRMSGLPWVADYRDRWSGGLFRRGRFRTAIERALERKLMRRASSLVGVSDPISDQLRQLLGRNDVLTLPNAYDPSSWDSIPDGTPQDFDLYFTGRIYDGLNRPEVLLEALAQLRSEQNPAGLRAKLHFYGPHSDAVERHAHRLGIAGIVAQHGLVSRSEAMRVQRRAAGLLIFLPMDNNARAEMGSKYLEYLGAHRYIVAVGPHKAIMAEFLRRNQLGWFATTVEEAKIALKELFARFAAGEYAVHRTVQGVMEASELAGRFARELDRASVTSKSVDDECWKERVPG